MNKGKRALGIILLLCLSVAVSFTPVLAEQEPGGTEMAFIHEFGLLKQLGIVTDSQNQPFDTAKTVTRGQFCKYAIRICGMENTGQTDKNTVFMDMESGRDDFYAVNTLYRLHILSGYGDGTFRPDEPILFEEAAAALMKLLGYDIYAQRNGGYPTGYLVAAKDSGLLKGVNLRSGSKVTGENMGLLLFNALQVEIVSQNSFGGGSISLEKGSNFLSMIFDVYTGRGIVEENQYTGLHSQQTSVSEGYVSIDGSRYACGETEGDGYLGYRVTYFYRDNDGDPELVYVYADEKYNRTVSVNAQDIESVQQNVFRYVKDAAVRDKIYEIKYSGEIEVIYNGTLYPYYTDADLMPEIGGVTFIDNDTDGTYEVVLVRSFFNYVVDSVSSVKSVIHLKKCDCALDLEPEGREVEYRLVRDGASISLEDLRENDVLTVSENKEKTLYTIYVSNEILEGTVEQVEEDLFTWITVGGIRYQVTGGLSYAPQVDDKGPFLLDYQGRVVGRNEKLSDRAQYGFLMGISTGEGLDESVSFKILMQEGMKVFEVPDKISLNGGEKKPSIEAAKDEILLKNGLMDGDKKTVQQLVTFEVNQKNQVTKLNTYEDKSGEPGRKTEEDEKSFTLDYKSPADGLYYRGGRGRIFGAKYRVNAGTIIFKVPEVYSSDERNYSVHNIGYLSNDRQYKNLEFFDLTRDNISKVILMKSSSGSASNIIYYDLVTIVEKVVQCFANEELTYKLYGYQNGERIELTAYSADLADPDEVWGNGVLFRDLKPGDVIQVSVNSFGLTDEMRVVFNRDSGKDLWETVSGGNAGLYYIHGGIHAAYGEIIYKSNTSLVVNAHDLNDPQWDRTYGLDNAQYFYKVSKSTGKVSRITVSDLKTGDKVFIQGSYSVLQNVILYE